MFAFDLETVRDGSLFTVAAAILLALLAVWLVKQVVTKVLSVVVLLAVAGLVWSQRAELIDCVDRVRETLDANLDPDTTCTFFGQDVTIPGRDSLFDPGGSRSPERSTTTATTTTAAP